MGVFSWLFKRQPPTKEQILNNGLEFAMKSKPVHVQLKKKYKFLIQNEIDDYSGICANALSDGLQFLDLTLGKLYDEKKTIKGSELKMKFNVFMLEKYDWIDKDRLSLLYGHAGYYIWREGLLECVAD